MKTEPTRILDLSLWAPGAPSARVLVRRLRSDSRQVEHGDLYLALAPADRVAAHIDEALRRGAAAVLADAATPDLPPRAHGVVDLAARAGEIAHVVTGRPTDQMTLVGVTGTNGKTSTVQLVAQAWALLGVAGGSVGTLGAGLHGDLRPTGLTTPTLTDLHEIMARMREERADAVALELSSHALTQGRVDGCRFDVVAFTNLTRDHLDYHDTMAAYGEAKRRILHLPGVSSAVLNLDDDFIAGIRPPAGIERVGVTSRGARGAAVRARRIRVQPDRSEFELSIGAERARLRSPLLGRFNVDNLAMAAGILHAQGFSAARIFDAVAALERVAGRMQPVGDDAGPRVFVDYAHTPDALRKALEALAVRRGRLILVFGCAGDRDRGKRAQMARIAEEMADVVILTDDDLHHEDGDAIVADIVAGFADTSTVWIERDRAAAIAAAIGDAGPDDTVIIAGKGHETEQVVGDVRVPSDDVEFARRALQQHRAPQR